MEWSRWMRDQDLTSTDEATAIAAALVDAEKEQGYWDDLKFPASAVNPPGLVSDPDYDTTYGGWLFAATGTELLFLQGQLPHRWVVNSALHPHVHWQKTTSASGDVVWELQYRWARIGYAMDTSWTTLESSSPVAGTPDTDTANQHLITGLGEIEASGKGISDMLIMKLSRLGSDADDTYGADCRLLEFDIHVYQNHGSELEFSKT